ncbi:calcium/sodium antiporter [Paenirhodobacter sp. CAU 1674]|uniref:calcium/sodium antiporter n=1 Tax=Paenirhodobacter sp. CAU 1674 TaxID=3032596 RepID=UPI0023DCB421|nr:calcium/sodium antiporter [Paenirhodobacter sp. CAU 1674]MDF2141018.1 calcium/sodium antiporter [Paenirhodobacter sp. CAU 1674]
MLWDLFLIAAGLGLLVIAGDLLVKGAVNLSLRLGIPALIVGLTVVAFGTSAPEMMVSVAAVLNGTPDIALGNVIGSNTANILLVLGIPAIISVIRTDEQDLRESYLIMLGASVLFILLSFMGPIGWPHALVLLAALALILTRQIREALAHRAERAGEEIEGADLHMGWPRIGAYILAGLIGLPLGANFLVDGASSIARAYGISEAVIGLTLVAVGTSLPELATSITAAIKGRADVALGNVIGSNIFNLLCIIGVAGLFGRMPVPASMLHLDLWVMLGAALLIAPFIFYRWSFRRLIGIGFTGIYVAYVIVLVTADKV